MPIIRDMTASILVRNIKHRIYVLTSLDIYHSFHKRIYAPYP